MAGAVAGLTTKGQESGADWQRALLTYAAARVAPDKVLSGLPTYGYDYSTENQVRRSSSARHSRRQAVSHV
jgi:spore germination protein YaaH